MAAPRILTTVVGSYPVPDWLAAAPSEQALIDATRVVIATQEQAGIDVVCDGELYRFDLNHPETNGMIEYFVRPMSGIRPEIGFSEWLEYAQASGMRFRTRPPGVVEGPVGAGTLNLPIPCARARALATRSFKFTLTGPHMLAKTLHDRHYGSPEKLAEAIAKVLAEQVRRLDADVVQIDEANLPGHPDEWRWAARAINVVLRAVPKRAKAAVHLCFGNYGGQSIQKPQSGCTYFTRPRPSTVSARSIPRAISSADSISVRLMSTTPRPKPMALRRSLNTASSSGGRCAHSMTMWSTRSAFR